MTSLHAYFNLRNQQAFQRLLDASSKASASSQTAHGSTVPLSTSGGTARSWSKTHTFPSALSFNSSSNSGSLDVNARDWLGRTVLHLAVSAVDVSALEYVKLLLSHPSIDVNVLDTESHWSALHRALYVGNLAAWCVSFYHFSSVYLTLICMG